MSLNGGRVEDHRRMIVRLDTHRLQTLDQVREFLDGSEQVDLQPQTRADAYAFVAKTVRRGLTTPCGGGPTRACCAASWPRRPACHGPRSHACCSNTEPRERSPTAAAPRADRSRAATPTPTLGCWPSSTCSTVRCRVRPRASGVDPTMRSYSANAKGNFQFDRVITGWRKRPALDWRLKR